MFNWKGIWFHDQAFFSQLSLLNESVREVLPIYLHSLIRPNEFIQGAPGTIERLQFINIKLFNI